MAALRPVRGARSANQGALPVLPPLGTTPPSEMGSSSSFAREHSGKVKQPTPSPPRSPPPQFTRGGVRFAAVSTSDPPVSSMSSSVSRQPSSNGLTSSKPILSPINDPPSPSPPPPLPLSKSSSSFLQPVVSPQTVPVTPEDPPVPVSLSAPNTPLTSLTRPTEPAPLPLEPTVSSGTKQRMLGTSSSQRKLSTSDRRRSCVQISQNNTRQRKRMGRYRKGKRLGGGATGTVFQGIDQLTGQFVAIKEVKGEALQIKEVASEFDLLQKLHHPNIVRYIDYEYQSGGISIYLELVDGGSLTSVLHEFGRFSEPILRNYVRQIVNGLHYLHDNGVLHRDIKPANILVATNGTVKLADFGASKAMGALTDGEDASLAGTPMYMAPETIRGDHSFASDIWALGCTVVELATGKAPWEGIITHENVIEFMMKVAKTDVVPKIPPHLSPSAQDFIRQCLQRDPTKRATCEQVHVHPFLEEESGASDWFRGDSGLMEEGSQTPVAEVTQTLFPTCKIQNSLDDSSRADEPLDMRGVFIAAHLCNDVIAETFFEDIIGNQQHPHGIWLSTPQHPSSPFRDAESVIETGYIPVSGTPDGLITLQLSKLPKPASSPDVKKLHDETFKFDVYFDEKTSPKQLFDKIGEPILRNLIRKDGQKRVTLTCTGMIYSGETQMSIGKSTRTLDVFKEDGQGFLPILFSTMFKRHSKQYDIFISSCCAKKGKAAVFDNLGHQLLEDKWIWSWETLGKVIRKQARTINEGLKMMDLAQLAFQGVSSPHMFVIELRPKGEERFTGILTVSLYYGRQWAFWLNGLTYTIHQCFEYYADLETSAHLEEPLDHEGRMYRKNPLLVILEEAFHDERSMNYVLHNFH
eukprot:Sspe_Gene.84725::Locus_55623_Transcript_1_1_Confidence_1.000_Length_2625::g.84725::m.84725